jgi:hypothetical protein
MCSRSYKIHDPRTQHWLQKEEEEDILHICTTLEGERDSRGKQRERREEREREGMGEIKNPNQQQKH